MSKGAKVATGAVVLGVVLMWTIGFWWGLLVMVGVPVAAYLMLDSSQRRRLRQAGRKQLGR